MLYWRLIVGTLLIATLVGLCWLDHLAPLPGMWLMPVGIGLAILATAELLQMMKPLGINPQALTVYGGIVCILLCNWIPFLETQVWGKSPEGFAEWHLLTAPIAWPLLVIAICTIAVFAVEMCRFQKPGQAIKNISAAIFALVYIGLLFSFLIQLRLLWGVKALASLIIVVKLGDTGAYFTGRLFGRHKLTPVLSPNKTVEGAIGAILFACLGAWLSYQFVIPAFKFPSDPSGPWWGWIPYGILLAITGMLGDLAESLIKRDAGHKDSSNWLPGLGGLLDILDSLLFAAPFAWFYWGLQLIA